MNKKIVAACLLFAHSAQSMCVNNGSLSIPQNAELDIQGSSMFAQGVTCKVSWENRKKNKKGNDELTMKKFTITCYDENGIELPKKYSDVRPVLSALTGTPGWLSGNNYLGSLKIEDSSGRPGSGKKINFYARETKDTQ